VSGTCKTQIFVVPLSSHRYSAILLKTKTYLRPLSFEQANQAVSFNHALFALFNFKYHKMKTKVLLIVVLIAAGLAMSSCASSKGGCKMTAGYVGYGTR